MARIYKVRTIPRGYVPADIEVNDSHTNAEWFMVLYSKCGNPQEGGMWSYLIRHYGIVLRITATSGEERKCSVWVSPKHVQDARRKRTKAVNVIARRFNEKDIPFVREEDELYYAVRKRNAELLAKVPAEDAKVRIENGLTDEERNVLYGKSELFMTDAKDEITKTINELFENGRE